MIKIGFNLLLVLPMAAIFSACGIKETVCLTNGEISMEWRKTEDGYVLKTIRADGMRLDPAVCQHGILYSETEPSSEPETICDDNGHEIRFPDPKYRYIVPTWQQNITPVSLNHAGESIVFFPDSASTGEDGCLTFIHDAGVAGIVEKWSMDPDCGSDVRVTTVLAVRRPGYYSVSTPSVASFDKSSFSWAAVPGIYQGDAVNPDFVRALAYGQGIPDRPVVSRERTASTLMSCITDKRGVTVAVTAEPGTGRDPWEYDRKTNAVWKLGLSLMNREGEFTPTLYHPVLGEAGSYAEAGDTLTFSFRYTVAKAGWHSVFGHIVKDIYRFPDGLRLRKPSMSLTDRLYDMHRYLVDDSTSMWRNTVYKGVTIGAQDYRGGVYGSEKDAMKNSDYGAMWMLAALTGDVRLTEKRLPYALNFKLMQQNTDDGFMKGSSAGQYYLYKSGRFTEEWGPYTEPVATTYYMLMDMGNILLFEPEREDLKDHLRMAADCLLRWQKPDGSWEVAYDNASGEPIFTDVKDLRPTFYGLLVAYRILGDGKYLEAARKGADWYVENAVGKGHFLGVCGDTRFAPDFATAQSVQALLDLYDAVYEPEYFDAAVKAARIYMTSVYTHPVPTEETKIVKGVRRKDWEISQSGLGFEHGGVLGSANHRGPILLASHAGMFVRMFSMTRDSLFLQMARSAAVGRDAFVDKSTGVASYYWDTMDNGAGPYPHHAWWQTGWIMDYLISEAELRSDGQISFPGGFATPKVGPHRTFGFAPGRIFGEQAVLIMRQGLVSVDNPCIEYLLADNREERTLSIILMNSIGEPQEFSLTVDMPAFSGRQDASVKSVAFADASGKVSVLEFSDTCILESEPYGLGVITIKY